MAGYNWDKATPQVASSEFARAYTPLRVSDPLTPDDPTKDVLKQTSMSTILAAGATASAQAALDAVTPVIEQKADSTAVAAAISAVPDNAYKATSTLAPAGAFSRSTRARFGDVIDLAEYIDPAANTHAANAARLNALFASGAVSNGKTLLIPPWDCNVKKLILPGNVDRVRFVGQGRNSRLLFDETSNDWISLGANCDFFEMCNLSLGPKAGNVLTGGWAINMADGNGWFLPRFENLWIASPYGGISLGKISDSTSTDYLHQPVLRDIFIQDAISRGVQFGGSYDPRLDNVSIAMTSTSTGIGFLFTSWTQGGYAKQCQVIYGARGWQWGADSGSPLSINAMSLVSCVADQASAYGFYLNACDRITLTKCITGSQQNVATGIYVGAAANCTDIEGMQAENLGGHGVVIDAAARTTAIRGGRAVSCSLTTANTYHGILANNNAQDFLIDGVRAFNRTGYYSGTQAYGIAIGTGCDNYTITNNSLRGNQTGGILNNSSAATNKVIANNLT